MIQLWRCKNQSDPFPWCVYDTEREIRSEWCMNFSTIFYNYDLRMSRHPQEWRSFLVCEADTKEELKELCKSGFEELEI